MKKGSVTITYRQEKQINTLHFTYNTLGNKLQKTVTAAGKTTTTDYANGLLYKNGQLQFASHPEGYLEPKANGTLEYVYQYTDHLGNIRLSYKKKSSGVLKVIEENNYYPFGLRHEGYNNLVDGEENPYRYNGKELNEELGLGWYDYGARFYEPTLARWMAVDPLAEKYAPCSPYNYVLGNPVRLIDPDGRSVDDIIFRNSKKEEIGRIFNGSKDHIYVDINTSFSWKSLLNVFRIRDDDIGNITIDGASKNNNNMASRAWKRGVDLIHLAWDLLTGFGKSMAGNKFMRGQQAVAQGLEATVFAIDEMENDATVKDDNAADAVGESFNGSEKPVPIREKFASHIEYVRNNTYLGRTKDSTQILVPNSPAAEDFHKSAENSRSMQEREMMKLQRNKN